MGDKRNILVNEWMQWAIIIVLEVIIVVGTARGISNKDSYYERKLLPTDLFITEDCPDAVQNEDGISIDRTGSDRADSSLLLACGPFSELPRGNYQITYHYETDTNDSTYHFLTDKEALDVDFLTNVDGYFQADQTSMTTEVKLLKDVESYEIQCQYYGTGRFTLHSIDIMQTGMNYVEIPVLCLIFLLVDICFALRKKLRQFFSGDQAKYAISLLLLLMFSNVVLAIKGLHLGSDIEFHFLRVEGIKEAILSGQFPSRIHPEFVRGYGYASGVMYPDFFLYIPAVLRLLGIPMITAYKMFVCVINAITIAVSFYSLKGIFKENKIALLGTVMYTLAPYRMIDVYYRAAVGEYCAMIGLPLIAYGIYRILQKESEEDTGKGIWIPLTLGFSVVMESHILSSLFITFFTAVILLIFWKRTFQKKCIFALLTFAVTTLALNAWLIIPWLDYYRLPLNTYTDSIGKSGLMLAQIVINSHVGDVPGFNKVVSDGIIGETPFGMGYAIILTTALFVLYGLKKKETVGKVSLGIGMLAIIFATCNFPWDRLAENKILSKLITNIQFPWRFLMIATVAFVICGCVGVQKASVGIAKNFLILCAILLSIYGFTTIIDGALERWVVEDYGIPSINSFTTGPGNEYMLQETDVEQLKMKGNSVFTSSEEISARNMKKQGTNISLEVVSTSEQEQFLELPLLLYPGYQAGGIQSHTKLNVDYGQNHTVRVLIPAHFSDTIQVSFAGKWYWRVGEGITLITAGYMLWAGLLQRKRYKTLYRKELVSEGN